MSPEVNIPKNLLTKVTEKPCLGGVLKCTEWRLGKLIISHLEGNFAQVGRISDMVWGDAVHMVIVFKGGISGLYPQGEQAFMCAEQTHNMVYPGKKSWDCETHALGLQAFMIGFEPGLFLGLAGNFGGVWAAFAAKVAMKQPACLFPKATYLDLPLQNCLQQVLRCPLPPGLQTLYLEAKAMEMMALQAACWQQAQYPSPRHSKTDYDRERLLFAKEYLLKHMSMPPTLPQLALAAGINEFKLKRGFKEMFGNSVFAYLAEARLEKAYQSLLDGRKTATEIAFELGYSSLQHFSSRFKERFGLTPSALKQKQGI